MSQLQNIGQKLLKNDPKSRIVIGSAFPAARPASASADPVHLLDRLPAHLLPPPGLPRADPHRLRARHHALHAHARCTVEEIN